MKPKLNNRLMVGSYLRHSLLGLGSLWLTVGTAAAATVNWDTNFTAAGSGNIGSSWEGVNWSGDPLGTTATSLWKDGDSAVFSAGTDGTGDWTVNLASTVATPSITFAQTGSKTINGGTITIGGGALNSAALGFAPGNGDDINLNSVLAGTGGLTIAAHGDASTNNGGGGGAEFRLGGINTFSGGLTITSGLVSWSDDKNLGDVSNVITLNGGGLLYTGTSLTTARTIKIGAAGGTFRNYASSTLIVDGTVSNATGLGSTTVRRTDGGTLQINTTGAGFVGTWINGGGVTQFSAPNADWSATDFTVDGGNLVANGTGTAVMNSINSSADVIIDNGTTLNVDTGAITMRTAHYYKTNVAPLGMLTSSIGTLTVTNGAATGDLATTDHQIQVKLVDSGATPLKFVKNNNNSLVLTQANSYTGGTTINGGRIHAANAGSFGTGTVTVNPGGQAFLTLGTNYANNFIINGNGVSEGAGVLGALRFTNTSSVSGSINVATASRVNAYNPFETGIIAGPLTGSAALEKTGAGNIVLSGNASGYNGQITVSQGNFRLSTNLGGSLSAIDGTFLAGEGTVAGTLAIGSSSGADLYVNGSTPAALNATNLTLKGQTYVRLTSLPATPGSPIEVLRYSGTLTMTGTAADNFQLFDTASYRSNPTFANTGTAITMSMPPAVNLVWRGNDPASPTFWDTNITANWKNGPIDPDYFYAGDYVLFDDTSTNKTVDLKGLLSPAKVTFNNSAGDYVLSGAAGVGFTGPASIVKNGTGTATVQGYGHTYTGTVTINQGILQADGNYELLGNSSGITINNGGQLNMNGANLGAGVRNYDFFIAGNGANGLGAITNTSANSPFENAGILNLTLMANASVGGDGGRFDIGRSGSSFGAITGNGFTLTKVGTGSVCMRTPASALTYVVAAGTLKFEDSDTATGPNPIAVNAGTLQSYGNRSFSNVLNFAAGTTLDNDGGGSQIWTGPIHLTGTAADTVNLNARNGFITLSGVISGSASVNAGGASVLYLTGAASNTYTGTTTVASTGQLVLSKTGGAIAVPGDLYMSATGTRAIVSMTQDNQFGPNSVLRYTGNGDTRLELKGTRQTFAGVDNTTASPGYNCIQQSEFGAPASVDGVSDLVLNLPAAASFSYNGVLRDQGGLVNLTKSGTGTQTLLGGYIDFHGTTAVTAGRLVIDSDDVWTSALNISAGAVYEVNVTSLTDTLENRQGGYTLTGTGTYVKSGPGNMTMGYDGGATVAMSSGALIDIIEGTMRNEYGPLTKWTTNKSDMHIAAGASLNLWDNNNDGIFVDALTGDGAVTRTDYAVTGSMTVGVDNGSGDFSGSISDDVGKTNLIKVGTGTQTLSGANNYSGDTTVSSGTLLLAAGGSLGFTVTDAGSNKITGTGTVALNGAFTIDTSAVTLFTGSWLLVDTGPLDSSFGAAFSPGAGWVKSGADWSITIGSRLWSFSETTGILTLSSSGTGTYASWIAGYFPGQTDASTIGAGADPDHDGIANAVELVTGGNPATGMDAALLPTLELVKDPQGLPTGDYFLFTYRRTDLSASSSIAATVEFNTVLGGIWTPAQNGVAGVVVQQDDNYASFVPPATDTDRVRVFIPRGTNARLFGRLSVKVP